MSMTWVPTPVDTATIQSYVVSLNQTAGTYNFITAATGRVYCEILLVTVDTAASGLTSLTLSTDHAGGSKSVVGATLLASLLLDAQLSVISTNFVLPAGKHVRVTLVGNGTGGSCTVVARWVPLDVGATLS